MKKLFVLLFALTLGFGVVGCSGQGTPSEATDAAVDDSDNQSTTGQENENITDQTGDAVDQNANDNK